MNIQVSCMQPVLHHRHYLYYIKQYRTNYNIENQYWSNVTIGDLRLKSLTDRFPTALHSCVQSFGVFYSLILSLNLSAMPSKEKTYPKFDSYSQLLPEDENIHASIFSKGRKVTRYLLCSYFSKFNTAVPSHASRLF